MSKPTANQEPVQDITNAGDFRENNKIYLNDYDVTNGYLSRSAESLQLTKKESTRKNHSKTSKINFRHSKKNVEETRSFQFPSNTSEEVKDNKGATINSKGFYLLSQVINFNLF